MAEPGRPLVYVVAVCDGGGCVEVLVVDNAAHPRQAVRRLATIAAVLRRRGVLGTAVLTEGATGRTVATRRIWP